MKYFTKELWMGVNSCDENIRKKAEQDWIKHSTAYHLQFDTVSKNLPGKFVKGFVSRNGLHDYTILEIALVNKSQVPSCQLKLSNGNETISMKMKGIKAFQTGIDSFDNCIQGKLTWGYSEFEMISSKTMRLSILCDVTNEMMFEFEKITLKRLHKKRIWGA